MQEVRDKKLDFQKLAVAKVAISFQAQFTAR